MIKAVIWDIGGVILRTTDPAPRMALANTYHLTLDEIYNLVFNSESALAATLGRISEEEHWQNTAQRLGLDNEQLTAFREAFWAGDEVDKDLLTFIRSLRPELTAGLLSNAWSGARKALTDVYHCLDVFDFSVFSSEVGFAKPDLVIYQRALAFAGCSPPEAIFIDDMVENVESAASLGIRTVRFVDSRQTIREIREMIRI